MKFLIFLTIFYSTAWAVELCTYQGTNLDPVGGFGKGVFGVRCHALDWTTWKDGWKSPCDCLNQKDLLSKMKRQLPKIKKREQEKIVNVTAKVEKKIADTILNQLTYNFEQSIRLDVYLKKGIVSTENLFPNGQSFPSSCRIQKVDETIKSINTPCNSKLKKQRMELLFGKGKDFNSWYEDQKNSVYKDAVTNTLSDKEKGDGMCMPYKSFLSINNVNPLRTTYLKVAQAFGSDHDSFLQWVADRSTPGDAGSTIIQLQKAKTRSKPASALDFLRDSSFSGLNPTSVLNIQLSNDRYEDIADNDIQHLLKTDPIFERMVRDEKFFNYITQHSDADSFNTNNPDMIKEMIGSQQRGCEQLYGKPDLAQDLKSGGNGKNMLTRFLCEEDFPKKFIDNDIITESLAPELAKGLSVNEIDAEDMIVDYLYCKGNSPKEYVDGRVLFDLSPSETMAALKKDDLRNMLNFKLNPDSDLRNTDDKKNDYKNFNKSVCKFVKEECNTPEEFQKPRCNISSLAVSIPVKMINDKYPKEDAAKISKKLVDPTVSDSDLRDFMNHYLPPLLKEEMDAILIMRHQQPRFQSKDNDDELRSALGDKILPTQKVSDYLSSVSGGASVVFASLMDTPENKRKYSDLVTRWKSNKELANNDKLLGDSSDSDRSSLFSNYFALSTSEDEKRVVGYKSSSQASSVDRKILDPKIPISVSDNSSSFYQRRSFDVKGDSPGIGDGKIITDPVQPTKSIISQQPVFSSSQTEVTKTKGSKDLTGVISPQLAVAQKDKKVDIAFTTSSSSSSDGLSREGHHGKVDSALDNQLNDLEKAQKDLEDQLNKKSAEYDSLKNSGDSEQLASLAREKKRLSDQINNFSNGNSSAIGRGASNNYANNFNSGSNNSWNNNFSNAISNKPFNNGYARGEEFDAEKANKKLDDGSPAFDPENASKGRAPASAGGESNSSGGKGKGGAAGAKLATAGGEDGEGGADGSGPGGAGRKKGRGGNNNNLESEVALKCGTGSVMKCIFPNSYFVDEKIKGRLYTVIANLKLEGKRFQGLEKVRKSKRDMKMGESYTAKYFLYTYDLVPETKGRPVTDQEREAIYNEIKTNRNDPAFKKTLIKYRYMTKALPAKTLLNERDALDAVNRSITREEYEALQD